ncbi:MAG: hypothetical protein AAB349_02110 [Chloroflexota bacterium]
MNADLRGRHDLGEIVGYAYRLYARNFTPLFLIAAVTIPLQLLIGVIQQGSSGDEAQVAASLLNIPAAIVGLIASAALIFAVHDATGGTAPDFSRSLDAAFERFGAVFKTSLLAGILAILALGAAPALAIYWLVKRDAAVDGQRNWWFALVPGVLAVYLIVRWAFIQQSVMIEARRNWAALDESAAIVRGSWWRTVGVLLVVALIQLGPLMMSSAATLLPPLASAAITSIVFALVIPFPVTAQTLLYYDLKARKQPDVSADRLPAAEQDVPRQGP